MRYTAELSLSKNVADPSTRIHSGAPGATTSGRSWRIAARALVLLTLVALLWERGAAVQEQLSKLRVGIDDANIYLRYGRNIADGLGCVWNPGGERVEGCTSPLWVALCTLGFLATPTPETALYVASLILAAIAAWIVALELARLLDPAGGALATLVAGACVGAWLAASPGCVVWLTATLMDTPLWTAAIVAAWSAAIAWTARPESPRRRLAFGAALAVLALARPEGPAAGLILLGVALLAGRLSRQSLGAGARALVVPAAVFGAAVVLMVVARRLYFGQWLPNTYYAKVDADLSYRFGMGFEYLVSFVKAYPVACVVAAAATAAAAARARSPAFFCAIALIAYGAFNAMFVGGDHFGSWRILQPFWLLLLVPIAASLRPLRSPAARAAAAAAIVIPVSALTLMLGPVSWTRLPEMHSLPQNFCLAEGGRALGWVFNAIFPPEDRPVVGIYVAGGFGFSYEGTTFDVLGLNDVGMAQASRTRRARLHGHGAFHAPTFFRRAPDLFLAEIGSCAAASPRPPEERVPFNALSPEEEREFDALFAPVAIGTEGSYAAGLMMAAWARRDWLAQRAERYRTVIREIVRSGDGWTYR